MALFLTSMSGNLTDHPSEDALERFILNRCEQDELEIVETHVIGCESCVARLEILEEELLNIKTGGELFLKHSLSKTQKLDRSWIRFFSIPAFALATAAAALICVSTMVPRDVTLSAFRGSEIAPVPEWHRLRIHLNARDLAPGPVKVELVDDQGVQRWHGESSVAADQVQVDMPAIRRSGEHFIRLEDQQGELLREFAIQAKLIP
ncbi:MAG: hypothetical protein JO270_17550 [Acidobacteriaceae bacterium]|nr:hypothetical protein [Acidobacteriaceae bacterium]MBV8569339.1 hypothetical protein [Acidobacteriaceae bacterium]